MISSETDSEKLWPSDSSNSTNSSEWCLGNWQIQEGIDLDRNPFFSILRPMKSALQLKGRVNLSEVSVSSSDESESVPNRKEVKRFRDSSSLSSSSIDESSSKESTCSLNGHKPCYKDIIISYAIPINSQKPDVRWQIYTFKDGEYYKPWFIHRQEAYLFGRDRRIADIPIDHRSCSKQHAVLQYREFPIDQEEEEYVVKPYLIDIGSLNGTFINDKKLIPKKYYEILHRNVVRFAVNPWEYIFIDVKKREEELKD